MDSKHKTLDLDIILIQHLTLFQPYLTKNLW